MLYMKVIYSARKKGVRSIYLSCFVVKLVSWVLDKYLGRITVT